MRIESTRELFMSNPPITTLFTKLVQMSTVKLSKIKIPGATGEKGFSRFGEPAIHLRTGMLYLPDNETGKIVLIDTENDRVVSNIENAGHVSQVHICQDRELVFTVHREKKEIRVFRVDANENVVTFSTEFYPEIIAFDSDRDTLLVLGSKSNPDGKIDIVAFYQYPDFRMIDTLNFKGLPVSAKYHEIEDTFLILYREPGNIVTIDPRKGLSYFYAQSLGGEEPNSFEVCLAERELVAGTDSGKVLTVKYRDTGISVVSSFKDPVTGTVFNPLISHLYVYFGNSRNLAIIDMETLKTREILKCSSNVSHLLFDETHNKIYAALPDSSAVEVYLDQGR